MSASASTQQRAGSTSPVGATMAGSASTETARASSMSMPALLAARRSVSSTSPADAVPPKIALRSAISAAPSSSIMRRM